LQPGLQRKCQEMLSALRKIEARNLKEHSLPGWRLHKLQSSPFVSLSVDMNFRALAKTEGDTIYFHRVVKHSLADSPKVNKNDSSETPFVISDMEIEPFNIHNALIAMGIARSNADAFKEVETEDDFLKALSLADETTANYALSLYETSTIAITRTRYLLLQNDKDFDA